MEQFIQKTILVFDVAKNTVTKFPYRIGFVITGSILYTIWYKKFGYYNHLENQVLQLERSSKNRDNYEASKRILN